MMTKFLKGQVWEWVWKRPAFLEGQDLENRAAHPHQEFPGVPPPPPPIEPLLSEIQACAKELITRNESREVGLFKCTWMYFQHKFNIKGTKKNEQGIVYLLGLAVFSIHIFLTDVHDTGRKAVIKRKQRVFIITKFIVPWPKDFRFLLN